MVDGLVNGIGYTVLILRWMVGAFDKYIVDGVGVTGTAWTIGFFGRVAKNFQSGDVQQYLRMAAYGALACSFMYLLIAKGM